MNIKEILDNYPQLISDKIIDQSLQKINENYKKVFNAETLKIILSLIDLTSLKTDDTKEKIVKMCEKVNDLSNVFPNLPNVAAICVYPSLIETVKKSLANPNIKIASVSAGFPSSQTFLDIKIAETKMAISKGANEIDIVISVGDFLSGNFQKVFDEIKEIKAVTTHNHLKVILETGALVNSKNIYEASILAMEAGADFIKTSTGKLNPAASLPAVYIMSLAIGEFYKKTAKKIGIKPAGGISNSNQAIEYFLIINEILGKDWINPELFRFGASSLANNLISNILEMETGNSSFEKYF